MTLTDNRKSIVDIDMRDGMADFPVASASGYELCGSDDTTRADLYLSYFQALYKYCATANGWQQCQSLPQANTVRSAMKFSRFQGYRGNVLGADNAGVDGRGRIIIPSVTDKALLGLDIRITDGKGIGQVRTISVSPDSVIFDRGTVTAVQANGFSFTDSTKKWKINQWIGYNCKLVGNTGISQSRRIIYNDATNLYFYDANTQYLENWNNSPWNGVAPYGIPSIAANSATRYVIEATTLELDSPWITIPDSTSSFVVQSGGLYNYAPVTAASNLLMYYDTLSDQYSYKTSQAGIYTALLGTDFCLEKIFDRKDSNGLRYETNKAVTSYLGRVLTFTGTTWGYNQWKNYKIVVVGGSGYGQKKRIIANTPTTITLEDKLQTPLDATSIIDIMADDECLYQIGGNQARMAKYSYERDLWSISNQFDYGITNAAAVTYAGQMPYAITTAVRNTGGITGVNPTPTAGGANYVVGDVLTISTGGTLGKVLVTGVSITGAVTQVELYGCGLTYTIGTGKATTGGTGTGCTIEITSVGTVGRVTLAVNHNLVIGDSITITGASESAWNTTYTILGCDSLTQFDIPITATATLVFASTLSTTVLVDSTKSWTVNEHKGKILNVFAAGYVGGGGGRKILSNTATTITFETATAPTNGATRYLITDIKPFGKASQYLNPERSEEGFATGGSTTTLIDTNRNRPVNCWAGNVVRIVSGTGSISEITIISNTANTLTYATQTFTPDTTTEYQIMDTYGTVTGSATTTTLADSTKKREVNQWIGFRVLITSQAGYALESTIASNTANTLTFAALATAPTTSPASTYCILDSSINGTANGLGTELVWDFNNNNGRYMYRFHGAGTNAIYRYDITKEKFEPIRVPGLSRTEVFSTGTQYCFDGKQRIYINPNGTKRIIYYDIVENKMKPFTDFPDTQGTAIIGNRMEIVSADNGEQFLYLNRQSTTNFYRILLPTY